MLVDELAELLDDATRIRLRADVPVGTYLSGGLDSSAVTALAQRHTRHPVHAFAIGFTDAAFDETQEQNLVANRLGTEVTRIVMDGRAIAELMPRVVHLSEKPTLRTAPAPLLKLSETVRAAGYKVVLTGEGADEMFAGYDVFARQGASLLGAPPGLAVPAASAASPLSIPGPGPGPSRTAAA